MPLSETEVRAALRDVKYPGFNRDIVSFGLVKSVNINDGEEKDLKKALCFHGADCAG